MTMHHLHIFLSSPGDVSRERQLAREVIDQLESERAYKDRLKLEVVGGPLKFQPEGFGIRNAYMCEVKRVGDKYRWVVDYVYPDLTYTREQYKELTSKE